jgi:pSer/pThr/pTyr-binding forkhead associated (FHA) protein
MAFHPISGITSDPGSGVFPSLIYVQGNEQRSIVMNRTPFSVGRKVDKDLVIPDPRVSRDHALIVAENGDFFVVDQGSKHGTYVNGERVQRQRLQRNDRVEFGVRDVAYVIFSPQNATSNTAREFLSQISGIQISTETTEADSVPGSGAKIKHRRRAGRDPGHAGRHDPEADSRRTRLRVSEG